MSDFIYEPLNKNRNEIRLIRLEDIDMRTQIIHATEEPLKCKLIVTRLDYYEIYGINSSTYRMNKLANFVANTIGRDPSFRGDFVALSYVWGNPTAVQDLEINGRKCKISKSLYEALRHVRACTTFRVIWCDAVCINQRDANEKSWQVQQMGRIYAHARATISWLGPASRDSDLAMKALHKLGERCNTRKYGEIAIALEGERSLRHERKLTTGILANRRPTVDVSRLTKKWSHDFQACMESSRWKAIEGICARPYWSRAWIFQEMASSRRKYFLCGRFLAEYIDQAVALLLAWEGKTLDNSKKLLQPHCIAMISALQSFQVGEEGPERRLRFLRMATLHELLKKLSSLSASDPRDVIYAPLAIATDRHQLQLKPDYSKSVELILKETACALIRQGDIGVLLSACLMPRSPSLPSWVPNWMFRFETDSARLTSAYRADRGRSQRKETIATIPAITDSIILDCYIVGQISYICDPCAISGLEQLDVDHAVTTFGEWLEYAEACILRPTAGTSDHGKAQSSNRYPPYAIAELLLTPSGPLERLPWLLQTNPYALLHTALKSAKSLQQTWIELSKDTSRERDQYMAAQISRIYNTLKGGSRVFRTDTGFIGLTWQERDQQGDVIAIIPGVQVPCVLRRSIGAKSYTTARQYPPHFELVGINYVYQVMDGGFFKGRNKPERQSLTLC